MCGAGGCPGCLVGTPPKYKSCRQPADARHVVAVENDQEQYLATVAHTRNFVPESNASSVYTHHLVLGTRTWPPSKKKKGTGIRPVLHDLQGDVRGLASDLHSVR